MHNCPEGKLCCPCPEFSKDGLCDWPYRIDMSFEEIKYMTELLQTVERRNERGNANKDAR
jgi:hypothetical protein